MNRLKGQCHCGAVAVIFETGIDVAKLDVRADQCGFCRRHGAKTVSDPAGRLLVRFRESDVTRYRFGLRTADFILCRHCGAFVAAITEDIGVLNVVGTEILELASGQARPVDFEGETPEQRQARRRERWTPVSLEAL